jgi:DNA-binding FadR family transcriptional regulator
MGHVDVNRHPRRGLRRGNLDGDALVARLSEGRPGPMRSLVRAVQSRQQLFKKLIDWRRAVTTQEAVADAMATSQSAVARLEHGGGDPKISTLERYAAAIGASVTWDVAVDEQAVADSPHLTMTKVIRGVSATVLDLDGLDSAERIRRVRPMLERILDQRKEREREAARLAAQHRTPAELARLESALDAIEELPDRGFQQPDDLVRFRERYRSTGREFHIALGAASHSDELCGDIADLVDHLYTVLDKRDVPSTTGTQKLLHAAIVDAIRDQDPEAAAEAVAAHFSDARAAFGEMLLGHLPSMTMTTVLQIREQAECLAAVLAAQQHSADDVERLNEALRSTQEIPDGGFDTFEQAEAFRAADRELHLAIAAAGHNPVVYELVEVAHRHFLDLLGGMEPQLRGFQPRQTGKHAVIVKAICEGRSDDAARATSDHIASTREALEQGLLARWRSPVRASAD